jgi:glycogen debranching enzyme
MTYSLDEQQCRNLEVSARREWILPNGIGGFAMGTVSGINTRRYHGHLVAATHPPTERTVLLAAIDATIQADGNPVGVSANQYPGAIHPEGNHYLRGFSVGREAVWRYRAGSMEVEKTLAMHPGENACTVRYTNTGAVPFLLILRPLVSHKFYHGEFHESPDYPQSLEFPRNRSVIKHGGVSLVLAHEGAQRLPIQGWYYRFEHSRELERGLPARDDLFCPCELRYELLPGESATLVASVGRAAAPIAPSDEDRPAGHRLSTGLSDAAEAFFVRTKARSSIMAGYPWFTDWGRDTMISLPGICLHTGRMGEARQILSDYAGQVRDGLIPNRFVEQGETPDYNTVDATLWFVNAVFKTLEAEWDEKFARSMLIVLREVHRKHVEGTLFGIHVDPADGLLTQGEPGLQLTWMDAKIGDWVVTPRHGKPVEVNGLWINALRVLEWLCQRLGEDGTQFAEEAAHAESSFAAKFWHEGRGHYLDTIEPDDVSLRPNQVIAMALPFGPAKGANASRALGVVSRELLTPFGLRTLGPEEPGYIGRFQGSLPELDAAYHQGTVWPWLLGPYATALVKIQRDRAGAKKALRGAKEMLTDYGLGGIAEVYDGDEPHRPGGCPWQAWSVAEILRAWMEDVRGE